MMKNQALRFIGCRIVAVFCLATIMLAEHPANGPASRPRLDLDGECHFRLDPQREGEVGKCFTPQETGDTSIPLKKIQTLQ